MSVKDTHFQTILGVPECAKAHVQQYGIPNVSGKDPWILLSVGVQVDGKMRGDGGGKGRDTGEVESGRNGVGGCGKEGLGMETLPKQLFTTAKCSL